MATLKQIKNTITLMAGADLQPNRFVSVDTAGKAVHAATGKMPVGVTQFDAKSGTAANIVLSGIVYVQASAKIDLGANVSADTDGKAVTTAAEAVVKGVCVGAAAAADDIAVILLV